MNTEFFVDKSDSEHMLANVTSEEVPWLLGKIEDGWEWLAFTFNDQEQIPLSKNEVEEMIKASDSVVKQAYARMDLRQSSQTWAKNTGREVDYILKKTDIKSGDFIYDLGCGIGRHAIEFANRGMQVVGIDYISQNIEIAKGIAIGKQLKNVTFLEDDCRSYRSSRKAKLVVCLYDVVGSFVDDAENLKIIETAYALLENGGKAVFSVMNYTTTDIHAKYRFSLSETANQLLNLPASHIMEKTGNVFDPDFYMVDTETHVVYRKEQFEQNRELPVELIVRDRRFTKSEIMDLCRKAGFAIKEVKYVNATGWGNDFDETDKKAKEILILCQKHTSLHS